jgi:phytoene dehydrogenase-like protein
VGRDVTVIEVASPRGGCAAQRECTSARGEKGADVISLCDPEGVVRAWYNASANAVLVLDWDGFVRNYGELKDYDYYRMQAEGIARDAAKYRFGLFHGGGGGGHD